MAPAYLIRPAVDADLALLRRWRSRPHVSRWWGPPTVEPADETLREAKVDAWIAEIAGRPFAFIQDYAVSDWPPHHFDDLPAGSRGLDVFIGETDLIGCGHGSALLRQHVDSLFRQGAPAVGIDPHPDNLAARRAFEKAGFTFARGPIETRWNRAVLMHRGRPGPITVRRATPADAAALRAILTDTLESTWAPNISEDAARSVRAQDRPAAYVSARGRLFWVAEVGEVVVGLVDWEGDFVNALHVRASHARMGVGARLMDHAEAAVRAGGFSSARLETDTFNLRSQAFYAARGYREADRYPDTEWNSGLTTLLLVKTLGPPALASPDAVR